MTTKQLRQVLTEELSQQQQQAAELLAAGNPEVHCALEFAAGEQSATAHVLELLER